jgi:hypothetical protein
LILLTDILFGIIGCPLAMSDGHIESVLVCVLRMEGVGPVSCWMECRGIEKEERVC